jgi:hypothetical protein
MPILRHISMSSADPGHPFVPIKSVILRAARLPAGLAAGATAAFAVTGRMPTHASA